MSTKRLTIEGAKQSFLSKGLILDTNIYINKNTHMECHDKNGYKYYLTLNNIKDKRIKKFNIVSKNNKFSIDNIQKFIYDKGYKTKILTKTYNNEKSLINCECECGNVFTTYWTHISTANKFTCNKCGQIRRIKSKTYNINDIENTCKKYGYILLKEYYNNASNLVIQDKYGYKYKTKYYHILNSKNKFSKFSKYNPFTIQNMILYIKINNLPIDLIDKTDRIIDVRHDYLSFYCIDCHKPFLATWSQITLNKRYRCKTCINKESNNEYIVRQYLEKKGINFIQEKKFKNCKNIKPLPFDFYIPSKNTVIEIHGGQHYYENSLFTQSLQERQKIDNIKKEYCIKNNINYVEIPYWLITESSIETYKQIIDNILEKD